MPISKRKMDLMKRVGIGLKNDGTLEKQEGPRRGCPDHPEPPMNTPLCLPTSKMHGNEKVRRWLLQVTPPEQTVDSDKITNKGLKQRNEFVRAVTLRPRNPLAGQVAKRELFRDKLVRPNIILSATSLKEQAKRKLFDDDNQNNTLEKEISLLEVSHKQTETDHGSKGTVVVITKENVNISHPPNLDNSFDSSQDVLFKSPETAKRTIVQASPSSTTPTGISGKQTDVTKNGSNDPGPVAITTDENLNILHPPSVDENIAYDQQLFLKSPGHAKPAAAPSKALPPPSNPTTHLAASQDVLFKSPETAKRTTVQASPSSTTPTGISGKQTDVIKNGSNDPGPVAIITDENSNILHPSNVVENIAYDQQVLLKSPGHATPATAPSKALLPPSSPTTQLAGVLNDQTETDHISKDPIVIFDETLDVLPPSMLNNNFYSNQNVIVEIPSGAEPTSALSPPSPTAPTGSLDIQRNESLGEYLNSSSRENNKGSSPVVPSLTLNTGASGSEGGIILPLFEPVENENIVFFFDEAGTAEETVQEGEISQPTQKKRKRPSIPNEQTPPKKRQVNRQNWKAVKVKEAKDSGKAHISLRGKIKPDKVMGIGCKSTCRSNCHKKITEQQRQAIFSRYWELKNVTRQWDFIARLVRIVTIKRRTVHEDDMDDQPFRKHSYEYYLYDPATSHPIQVCQTMFVDTLAVSVKTLRTVVSKILSNAGKVSPDKRGKHAKKNRLHPMLVASVIRHINQFPRVESHYCRSDSRKKYLDEKLSVAKMHRMYLLEQGTSPHTATLRQFRDIFNTKFNLGFYKPKKDQCAQCLQWNALSEEEKCNKAAQESYAKHKRDKDLIREIRRDDKTKSRDEALSATTGRVVRVCTCDLQKVLYCPKGENSDFFYKRKLSCYDFTIFDSTKKQGYCYCWDSTIAKRGSDEVSSFIFDYISTCVRGGVNEFHIYSDNCGGQNKNQFLFSMYYFASMKFKIKIIHRWMEKGHTQMECDSVHARIENKTRHEEIFTPSQWWGHIKAAKVKKPAYIVKIADQKMISSFKDLAGAFTWGAVPITKIREITFDCNTPGRASYKVDYNGPDKSVSVVPVRRGRSIVWANYQLPLAYNGLLPLKSKLLKDMLWYVDKGHIPSQYCEWYRALADIGEDEDSSEETEEEPCNNGALDTREPQPQNNEANMDLINEETENPNGLVGNNTLRIGNGETAEAESDKESDERYDTELELDSSDSEAYD